MSNKNECEFSGVIVSTGDLSLEERVTALEKQLTDMQAAMSCDGDHMGFILDHITKMNAVVSTKP